MKTVTIQKPKIGDKIYCIKNRVDDHLIYNTKQIIHIKGKFYTITNATETCVAVSSEMRSQYNNTQFRNYKYYLSYELIDSVYNQFKQYFITIPELRKLKLQKLYNEKM